MAAPTFQAKGTLGQTTGTTATFTYPATQANDLLFLMIYDDALDIVRYTVNSSWATSERVIGFGASGLKRAIIYQKTATGSESGTENVTRSSLYGTNTFACQVYSFRGDAFLQKEAGDFDTNVTDTITWAATTVGGSQRTLCAFVINCLSGNPGTPSGYTNKASETLSDGTYFELNTLENVSAGTSVTATGGNADGWATFHISIFNNTPSAGPIRTYIVN